MMQRLYKVALSNKWRLGIGATVFAGSRGSLLGHYVKNAGLTLRLRYSF